MQLAISFLQKYALYIAFLQAWIATLGSLYFSEILRLPPCTLCWYQRILMYPLAIILPIAILRRDKNIVYYALPFSAAGILVALYQYLLQMGIIPDIFISSCSGAFNLCGQTQILVFNFITIPFLSFVAFIVITSSLVLLLKSKQ